MAEYKEPRRSLTSIVECGICHEVMTQPKALKCLHHYCDKCVQKLIQPNEMYFNNIGIECPECSQFTKQQEIKESDLMNNLLKIYSKREKTKAAAENNDLIFLTAQDNYDNTLGEGHTSDEPSNHYCLKHPTLELAYNCVTCSTAGCSKCLVEDHNGHSYEKIEDGLQRFMTLSKKHMVRIEQLRQAVLTRRVTIETLRKKCQSNFDETLKEINKKKEVLLQKIQKEYQKLTAQMESEFTVQIRELDHAKSDADEQLAIKESLLAFVDPTVSFNPLQDGTLQRLEHCAAEVPHTDVNIQLNTLSFQASSLEMGSLLGKVTIGNQQPADQAPEAVYQPDTETIKTSFRETKFNLRSLRTSRLEEMGHFQLNRSCARMSIIENKIFAPCSEAPQGCVDIYSFEGHLLNTIHCDQIQFPHSIHPHTDLQVLVAAHNGLFTLAIDGSAAVKKISGGIFLDVHIEGNRIVALESVEGAGQDTIHIYQNTNPPTLHRCFPLEDNESQTLMVMGDHIYVSFIRQGRPSKIVKFTYDGFKYQTNQRFGSCGSGNLISPIICAYDKEDSAIVVDLNKQQVLLVLNNKGQWRQVRLQFLGGKMFTQDAVFISDDFLFVLFVDSTEKNYHIIQYKLK